MKGNTRRFLEAEKTYKRAYRHLLEVQAHVPVNNEYLVGASLVYKMALGLLLEIKAQYGDNLLIVGHSLGGDLRLFAVAGVNEPNVEGEGFNSAGLSDMAYK